VAVAPVVTALRRVGQRRIAVDLDGEPWRVLPAEPVLAAGLDTGVVLDRERARRLRRELRSTEARRAALVALDHADHTVDTLRSRLAAKGIPPAQREAALATLTRAGLVDDRRFARERAAVLARRGAGDTMIRHDLEHRGVQGDLVDDALGSVEPEKERARSILEARGRSRRTVSRLAAKGFAADTIEDLIADLPDTELG
jgi:regulatory protein